MSEFRTLLERLTRLQAKAKAVEAAMRPVRAKATQMALERFSDEGSDRWARDDGLVSLVKPKPYVETTQPETLCGWLAERDFAGLVLHRVEVIDHSKALGVLRLLHHAKTLTDDEIAAALDAFDVRREPVADWADHMQWQADEDGTLITPDGEPIPGCRLVQPPIRSLSVRPAAELVEREASLLGDDDG